MSEPKHDSHEFRVKTILGFPIVVERWTVPATYGGPGDWEWTRWHFCRFAHSVYVNAHLMAMDKPTRQTKALED